MWVFDLIFCLEFLLMDDEVGEFWEKIKSNLNGMFFVEIRFGKSGVLEINVWK